MDADDYIALRPYAFHLTARSNIAGIQHLRRLHPAANALDDSELRLRRPQHSQKIIDGRSVHIRDQAPLHKGNCDLSNGWEFSDLIYELNQRVFFWPGADHPISYGQRHFERYELENPRLIRIATSALFDANPTLEAEVCKYNSGSPRCSYGRRAPRGPGTFTPMSASLLRPAEVVELTFRGSVLLPDQVHVATKPHGPWRPL